MLTEAIRLTLFPAMMAFAASSDLLTMTIANRVSLILVGGFARACRALRLERRRYRCRISVRPRRCLPSHSSALPAAGSAAATPSLRRRRRCGWAFGHLFDYLVYASLLGGALTLADRAISQLAAAARSRGAGMGGAAASPRRRRSLWHCARRGGACGLSANRMDDGARPLSAPVSEARINARLTRFGYASLTML